MSLFGVFDRSAQLRYMKQKQEQAQQHAELYQAGRLPPNYSVPAIPVHVGWQEHGVALRSTPYFWVCNYRLLWTVWKDIGLIEERI